VQECVESDKLCVYVLDNSRTADQKQGAIKFIESLSKSFSAFESFLFNNSHMSFDSRGVERVELSLMLCGDKKIKSLNEQYRDKNKVTDVLSFQQHDGLRDQGQLLPFVELGDLFICRSRALKQAKEYSIRYNDELIHLFVHGFLHLLGFDHEISEEEEKVMSAHEAYLIEQISKKLGK
jgi:probable rRNA maturation factor